MAVPTRFAMLRSIPPTLLFVTFAVITARFSIPRLPYLDIDRIYCAADSPSVPGECYWFAPSGIYRWALQLHLGSILPAALLACVQFLPSSLRPSVGYDKLHRANGYLIIFLALIASASAFVLTHIALGATFHTRFGISLINFMFLLGLYRAYAAVRNSRLDLHRAWMLRACSWVSRFYFRS